MNTRWRGAVLMAVLAAGPWSALLAAQGPEVKYVRDSEAYAVYGAYTGQRFR